MLASQDESVFYQFVFSSKRWYRPSGGQLILPKGVGEGIVYSAFTAQKLGFSYILSGVQIQRTNKN
jgi:hypothetical protein